MATPTLAALRELYPTAHISYLLKKYVKPIYTGMPWVDELITYQSKGLKEGLVAQSLSLRKRKYDVAVLLPNSFRSALVCKTAGIKRRVGYDRDGRGFLLTDRLIPPREGGKFVPSPIVKYYLALAQFLGSTHRDLSLKLFVTAEEAAESKVVLERAGLPSDIDRPGRNGQGPLVLLNPGAQYGAAKCWMPDRFAAVGDELHRERGATILLSGTPKERRILDEVKAAAKCPIIDLSDLGMSLGALKEVVRRCDLMVTNDTGPRHIAAAFQTPVVTIFGPTHREWTEIYFKDERQLDIKVDCGPCQLKTCPLDHRCMTGIGADRVFKTATELLQAE